MNLGLYKLLMLIFSFYLRNDMYYKVDSLFLYVGILKVGWRDYYRMLYEIYYWKFIFFIRNNDIVNVVDMCIFIVNL